MFLTELVVVFAGLLVAMSSTALVLEMLATRGETATPRASGR